MSAGMFEVYVRRADVRGLEWCGAFGDQTRADDACLTAFSDPSVTEALVIGPDGCTHGEPLRREHIPGAR